MTTQLNGLALALLLVALPVAAQQATQEQIDAAAEVHEAVAKANAAREALKAAMNELAIVQIEAQRTGLRISLDYDLSSCELFAFWYGRGSIISEPRTVPEADAQAVAALTEASENFWVGAKLHQPYDFYCPFRVRAMFVQFDFADPTGN